MARDHWYWSAAQGLGAPALLDFTLFYRDSHRSPLYKFRLRASACSHLHVRTNCPTVLSVDLKLQNGTAEEAVLTTCYLEMGKLILKIKKLQAELPSGFSKKTWSLSQQIKAAFMLSGLF